MGNRTKSPENAFLVTLAGGGFDHDRCTNGIIEKSVVSPVSP